MATEKSIKPTNLIPRSFGGEKNNFSDDLIANGYEVNAPQTYNGDNLNYQLDATGKELDYCEKVVDYINGLGVGKTPIVNANNKLDETQVGLKVYSATETYSLGEWVRSGDKIYQSLTQGNLGNDLTNETYWKEVELGGSGYRPPLLSCMWADHQLNDIQWLRGDTFSWQNGTAYSAVYNLLLGEYNNTASTEQTKNGITFKVTPRGFRIADSTQEQAILNLYNATGVAWFYILDPTNTRFKLPRTKYRKNTAPKSVPVTTSETRVLSGLHTALLFNRDSGETTKSGKGFAGFTFDNVLTSGYNTYGGNDSNFVDQYGVYPANLITEAIIEEYDNNMYLYFYVGEYTQTAVEQTAGLNAELFNGKVDLNFNNMNPSQTAKNTIVGWGMPDYSAGVSKNKNEIYTASYDCFVAVYQNVKNSVSGSSINLYDTNNNLILVQGNTALASTSSVNSVSLFIPKNYKYKVVFHQETVQISEYPLKGVN